MMSVSENDPFYDNRLYKFLANPSIYSNDSLEELHSILHEQPELANIYHPIEGSYFHLICQHVNGQENIAFRMIYALSNAGGNPNVTDDKGNTPLHVAVIRGVVDVGLDLIQALFRIGVDPCILNKQGDPARAYLEDNPQLMALFHGYGESIWAATETSNVPETERLVQGFIKVDCKDNSNRTLLDKARHHNCARILRILAEYQVTIEFVHSILACDWKRASLIHEYESKFIKINLTDSIHKLTWIRTVNRACSISILELCLNTKSSVPFDLIFNSSTLKSDIDVNILCTDGLPFFFHMFEKYISNDVQQYILSKANLTMKSSKGETVLFHLIHLYNENEDKQFLTTFTTILNNQPLLLSQRNQQGRTVIDEIELTPTVSYERLRVFYNTIKDVLIKQMKNNIIAERFVLNSFGYYLLLFFNDEDRHLTKYSNDLLRSVKLRQGLSELMFDFKQAVLNDDLIKVQSILKNKPNIYFARDWSGRTCAHLAALCQSRMVLNYICDHYTVVMNVKDNLNRTALHYACMMNDEIAIGILKKACVIKGVDCLNLLPEDYKNNRDLCCEEFYARDLRKNELERDQIEGVSDYLKLSFYFPLRSSIENSVIDNIIKINNDMNRMGFYLKNFSLDSYANDWIKGQRYVPLLFLALESRSVASFRCLIDLGVPLMGRMYISKSANTINRSRCVSFRTRAEELECFDIIGMINDLEDDNELKMIFKPQLLSATGSIQSQSPIKPKEQFETNTSQQYRPSIRNSDCKSQMCIML